MSALLEDIINLAIDGKQPLPDILRKCLLLGYELKNDQLKVWANQELNGYKSGKDVPEYRIIPAQAKGNFLGPFHAQYQGHYIPPAVLLEENRVFAETVRLTQSVSAYADIVSAPKQPRHSLVFNWPADMVGYYQDKLIDGWICHAAWQEVPANAIVELLDAVRNRTLKMALQIKEELGTSYTDLTRNRSKEAETKIQHIIFRNTGGNTNVAFGHSTVDASAQGQTIIVAGDREALDCILRQAGLDNSDLDNLTEAIRIDGTKPGSRVGQWVKDKSTKVLAGGIRVGTQIGSEILTAWIKQHYGM